MANPSDVAYEYKNAYLRLPIPTSTPPVLVDRKNTLPLRSRRLELTERWRQVGIRVGTFLTEQQTWANSANTLFKRGEPNYTGTIRRGLVITETPPFVQYTLQARWVKNSQPLDLTPYSYRPSPSIPTWNWCWRIVAERYTTGLYSISGTGPTGPGWGNVTHDGTIDINGELLSLPTTYTLTSSGDGAYATRTLQCGISRDGLFLSNYSTMWGPIYW